MCQNFFRHPHLRRSDDHLWQGRAQLRPGARASAAELCPQHRPPSCRRKSPSPAWPSPPRPTRRKKTPRWDTSTSSPMPSTAREGFVSANLARRVTGFSEEDLQLLCQAISQMFEHDHSAGPWPDAVRELIIFKHDSELGNAPAHKLFDTVHGRAGGGCHCPAQIQRLPRLLDGHPARRGQL